MKDNYNFMPMVFGSAIALGIYTMLCFGIYTDYQYKMKKLDLIEKGILKSCVEMVDTKI